MKVYHTNGDCQEILTPILSLLVRLGSPERVFLRSLPAILGLAHFATYDNRAISKGKTPPEAIAWSRFYCTYLMAADCRLETDSGNRKI